MRSRVYSARYKLRLMSRFVANDFVDVGITRQNESVEPGAAELAVGTLVRRRGESAGDWGAGAAGDWGVS